MSKSWGRNAQNRGTLSNVASARKVEIVTKLIALAVLQCLRMLNHDVVHLNIIVQLYLNKKIKIK